MQSWGEEQQQLEAQKELIELQHRHEMERMQYQDELRRQADERARQPIASMAPRLSEEELQRRREQVERAHPGWVQLATSPTYKDWLNHASPNIRRLSASLDPADVIYVLSVYKREMRLPP
jgi:hypothetical protein